MDVQDRRLMSWIERYDRISRRLSLFFGIVGLIGGACSIWTLAMWPSDWPSLAKPLVAVFGGLGLCGAILNVKDAFRKKP